MNRHELESLYFNLPIAVQNLVFTLNGFRLRYRRYGRFFHRKLEELKQSEWWSADQISAYQSQRLSEIVHEAYHYVPYYHQLFRELGIEPRDIESVEDLKKLPILTKQTVREQGHRMISQRFNARELYKNLTSGTTGTPLTVYLTKDARQFQWAVYWRHRARFGLRLGDRFLMFGARLPVSIEQRDPPFWRHNYAFNQVYLSTYHISPGNIGDIVEWLNAESFDFFTGYPSAMYSLAKFVEAQDLRLTNRPKYIVTGADALLPEFEETIRRVFGVHVTEQYGMVEACGNLAKCRCDRFHLDFEFCILETLPIPGLELSNARRLIFTGLANPAMPLIRYDVGDHGKLSDGECDCGRASLSLDSIDGRIEEFIRTPDGRLVIGMNQVFEWAPGVRETQVIQDCEDSIEILMVPDDGFDRERDQGALENELRKRLGSRMKLHFRVVDSIPRTSRGKFRAVVSNMDVSGCAEMELRTAVERNTLS